MTVWIINNIHTYYILMSELFDPEENVPSTYARESYRKKRVYMGEDISDILEGEDLFLKEMSKGEKIVSGSAIGTLIVGGLLGAGLIGYGIYDSIEGDKK